MEYFLFILFLSPALFLKNRYTYWISVVITTLLMAFRGSEDEYSRLLAQSFKLEELFVQPSLFLLSEKGLLLSIINGSILQYDLPVQTIFIFYVPLQIIIFSYVAYRLTPAYHIAFFIAMCQSVIFTSMSGLRMGLTASLTLLLIYYVQRSQKVKTAGIIVLSVANHYTAFTLPLIFLVRSQKIWFVGAVFVAAIAVKESSLLPYLFSFFPADSIVSSYLRAKNYTYSLEGADYLKTIQQVVTCFFVSFYHKKILSSSLTDRLLFGGYVLSTGILISFSDYAIFAYRLAAVFSLTEALIIAKIFYAYKGKIPFLRSAIFLAALGVSYVNYVILARVQPYSFLID